MKDELGKGAGSRWQKVLKEKLSFKWLETIGGFKRKDTIFFFWFWHPPLYYYFIAVILLLWIVM